MKKALIILNKNKKIFSFKIRDPKCAIEGEADIMLEAGNHLYFDEVIAGNYFRHFMYPNYKIRRISWHGYFEYKERKYVHTPLVNIKHNSKDGEVRIPLYHYGSIKENAPFAFPICSLYIPSKLQTKTKFLGNCKKNENDNLYVDIIDYIQNLSTRIDFFVLPKNFTIDQLKETHSYIFYLYADIDIFNTGDGNFVPLSNKIKLLPFSIGGHDILLRLVYEPNDMFREVNNTFSLAITEPNNIYEKLFDREIITYYPNDNKYQHMNSKELHEQEMCKKNNDTSLEKAVNSILKTHLKSKK